MSGEINVPRHRSSGGSGSSVSNCCIDNGVIIGDTLVVTNVDGSTTNIPLTGVEGAINFDNLTTTQIESLQAAMKGDLVCDAFDIQLGNLI